MHKQLNISRRKEATSATEKLKWPAATRGYTMAVSYTHLTLPTNREV